MQKTRQRRRTRKKRGASILSESQEAVGGEIRRTVTCKERKEHNGKETEPNKDAAPSTSWSVLLGSILVKLLLRRGFL